METEHPEIASFDSAGVRILIRESHRTLRWRELGSPILSLGTVGGMDPYLFQRVTGGLMLDGTIVVADGGALEIRLFDTLGSHLTTFGRPGEGPGEFLDLGWMGRYRGDSIMVFDRALQRVTILDATGQFGRAERLAPNPLGAPIRYVSPMADGSFFGRATVPTSAAGEGRGMWRDTVAVVRYSPEASQPRVIMTLPGDDRFTIVRSGGGQQINNHPVGRISSLIASGDALLYAEGSALSVDVLSPDGELTLRFRMDAAPQRVTDETITLLKAQFLGDDPEPGWSREVERVFSSITWPEYIPANAGLLLDRTGDVWLQAYSLDPTAQGAWFRFHATGEYLYTLRTPPGFTPLDFKDRFVLGRAVDDLGVEYITLHQIRVPGG